MNLLNLLFKAITSNREPDALPRSEVYHWRCDTCGDRYVALRTAACRERRRCAPAADGRQVQDAEGVRLRGVTAPGGGRVRRAERPDHPYRQENRPRERVPRESESRYFSLPGVNHVKG